MAIHNYINKQTTQIITAQEMKQACGQDQDARLVLGHRERLPGAPRQLLPVEVRCYMFV